MTSVLSHSSVKRKKIKLKRGKRFINLTDAGNFPAPHSMSFYTPAGSECCVCARARAILSVVQNDQTKVRNDSSSELPFLSLH